MVTLIIGGAGYLGSCIVEGLIQNGERVKIFDSLMHGIVPKPTKEVEVITGDITNICQIAKAMKGTDNVILLAGIVGDPACSISPEYTRVVNVEASKNIIDLAEDYKIKKLLFASSCSVYGFSEEMELYETSDVNPVSLYAKTKSDVEKYIVCTDRDINVDWQIFRLSTLFGYSPRMRFDLVINTLIKSSVLENKINIFGGNQWRPFVHVHDAAKYFVQTVVHPHMRMREIINIGSFNMKILDLADELKKINKNLNVISDVQNVDNRSYNVSFDKMRFVFGEREHLSVLNAYEEIERFIKAHNKDEFAKYPNRYSNDLFTKQYIENNGLKL